MSTARRWRGIWRYPKGGMARGSRPACLVRAYSLLRGRVRAARRRRLRHVRPGPVRRSNCRDDRRGRGPKATAGGLVATEAVLRASVEFLGAHEAVVGVGLVALGFLAGAVWALLLSLREPDLLKAVVAFYGTWQTDYAGARAAYLGHFAQVDEWEPMDEVRGTREALRAAGCEATFYTYPGVGHWFFEEDRVGPYDAQAARLAWERTTEFLRARLGSN